MTSGVLGGVPRVNDCHPERPHCALGLCRPCWRRQYKRAHPWTPEQRARYYASDRRRYRETGGERWIISSLRRTYNLSREQYDALLTAQGGVCAICRQPETNTRQGTLLRLAVDHDHGCCPGKTSCGRCIRGLLCGECNTGIAKFRDDARLMDRAIAYLSERAPHPSPSNGANLRHVRACHPTWVHWPEAAVWIGGVV